MPSVRKAGLLAVALKVAPREVAAKGGLAVLVAPVKAAEVPAAPVGT